MTSGLEGIALLQLRLIAAVSRAVAVFLVLSPCGVMRRFYEFARWVVIRISLLSTYGALAALFAADWFWPTRNTMQSLESERIMSCALKRPFSSPA